MSVKSLFQEAKELSKRVKELTQLLDIGLEEPKGREFREGLHLKLRVNKKEYHQLEKKMLKMSKNITDDELDDFESFLDYMSMLERIQVTNEDKFSKTRSFKIFSAWNLKGGSAKTTINYVLATLLAEKYNKRILYFDLDTQGTSSDIFDIENKLLRTGISDLLSLGEKISIALQSTSIKNVDIITNSISCDHVHHKLELSKNTGAIYAIQEKINEEFEFINDNYDYIFMDFAPQTHSLINKAGFITVDSFLYLTYPEPLETTLVGIRSFEHIYYASLFQHRKQEPRKAIVVNKFRDDRKASRNFLSNFSDPESDFGKWKLDTHIHERVIVGESLGNSNVKDLKKDKVLYSDFSNLINELIEKKIL